jgi:hypothetical protein
MKKTTPRKAVIVPGQGIACPRCNRPTQVRKHAALGERQLRAPFYYRRWFFCTNPTCQTTMIMRDEDRVAVDGDAVLWTETEQLPLGER